MFLFLQEKNCWLNSWFFLYFIPPDSRSEYGSGVTDQNEYRSEQIRIHIPDWDKLLFARESCYNPSSTGSLKHWKNKIKRGAGADVPLYKPTLELGRKNELKHWDLAWQFGFKELWRNGGETAEFFFAISRWIIHFWIIWAQLIFFSKKFP